MDTNPDLLLSSVNLTSAFDDDTFHRCWRLSSCQACLHSMSPRCGWCPFSSTCLPAPSFLLTPLSNPDTCPFPSERYELRTSPFGCSISSRNALSVIISVVITSVFWVSVFALFYLIRERRRRRNSFFNFLFGRPERQRWWTFGSRYGHENWEGGAEEEERQDESYSWSGWYPGWLFWQKKSDSNSVNRIPGSWQDGPEDNASVGAAGPVLQPSGLTYGAVSVPSAAARHGETIREGVGTRASTNYRDNNGDGVYANERQRLLGSG